MILKLSEEKQTKSGKVFENDVTPPLRAGHRVLTSPGSAAGACRLPPETLRLQVCLMIDGLISEWEGWEIIERVVGKPTRQNSLPLPVCC